MIKVSFILFNVLILCSAQVGENQTNISKVNEVMPQNGKNSTVLHIEMNTTSRSHMQKIRNHIKNGIKDLRNSLIGDSHENTTNVTSPHETHMTKHRKTVDRLHRKHSNTTFMRTVENSTSTRDFREREHDLDTNTDRSVEITSRDSYDALTPAWLVGIAIIGFVLAIFLLACFVSIGFSMLDVSHD